MMRKKKRGESSLDREILHMVIDLLKTKDKAVLNFRREVIREIIRLDRVYKHLKKLYDNRRIRRTADGILMDGIVLGTPATRSRLPEIYANYGHVYPPLGP